MSIWLPSRVFQGSGQLCWGSHISRQRDWGKEECTRSVYHMSSCGYVPRREAMSTRVFLPWRCLWSEWTVWNVGRGQAVCQHNNPILWPTWPWAKPSWVTGDLAKLWEFRWMKTWEPRTWTHDGMLRPARALGWIGVRSTAGIFCSQQRSSHPYHPRDP